MALFDAVDKYIVDPIFGNSKKQDEAAQEALNKALQEYTGINTPDLSTVNLQQIAPTKEFNPSYQSSPGVLQNFSNLSYDSIDPELYKALSQGDSKFNDISLDPRYEEAQNQSLSALQEIIAGGGLNAQDRANLAEIQSQVNSQDRGRREAIQQNMRMSGQSGSGLDLLAQLQSAQDASTRQSQADLDVGAQSQARQLDAILKSGQLGQSFGAQQFGQQSEVAKANDIINQFNVNNQNQASQYNTGSANNAAAANAANRYAAQAGNRQVAQDASKFNINNQMGVNSANQAAANQAGMFNTGNSQQVNQANANIANQGKLYNANLPQQQFDNQMKKAAGLSGQYGNISDDYARQADEKNKKIAQYIDAGLKAASIAANAPPSSPKGGTK